MKRDPIFAAIDKHRKLLKQAIQAATALEVAERRIRKKHGRRPEQLVQWRNYTICGREIDERRKAWLLPQWLQVLGVNRKQIEKEYRAKKAEELANIKAGKAWDRRHGVTRLRQENERAWQAYSDAGIRLSKTKPTTPAGAGALVKHLRLDLETGDSDWHLPALDTIAVALERM
jgi:hypothetical protein